MDQVEARATRRYSTPKRDARAAATRARILAAAERLFLQEGYARTTMKAIANEAGVSEKTMYLAFTTKASLLRQVIQVAVQGDEAGIPLAQRPEWRALLAVPTDEVFTEFARLSAALMTRTAAIVALGEAAAETDPELAEHRDLAHTQTRANLRALAAELRQRGALRRGVSEDHAADVIYAIATDEGIFLRLTGECGWSPARYADLIAHTLAAALAPA
jgi:AcrR family transcriptional regulator